MRFAFAFSAAVLVAGCAPTAPLSPVSSDAPRAEIPCEGGVARHPDGTAYPCRGVALAARLTPQEMGVQPVGSNTGNTIWGWTDPANGREYAIVGHTDGTRFFDVTVPTAPQALGFLPAATQISIWREIRVQGDIAVIVSEASGHGMQTFDMKRLRGLPTDAARRLEPTGHYTRFGSAHNVVVTEGENAPPFVYAVGSREPGRDLPPSCAAPGFHAIDLTDPAAPVFAGCFSDARVDARPVTAPGYTHDAQCLVYDGPDTRYTGRQICLASNENDVTIFDVTDKASVAILSQVTYPNAAYVHQGALTEDRRFFIVNDELDEANGLVDTQVTIVLNVADLENPELAFIYDSGQTVIDHNEYVRGRYLYQSNYEAGLRILDLERIADGVLTEIAYFDTYPQSEQPSFNGQWGNYPYFPSGTVIANDINNGFFILLPDVLRTPSTSQRTR